MPKTKPKSRLQPQHRNWKEDLPEHSAPPNGKPWLHDDLRSLNEQYLEVSRASSYLRGGGVLFGVFFVLFMSWAVYFGGVLLVDSFSRHSGSPAMAGALLLIAVLGWTAPVSLLRFDTRAPRDTPVRFDRHSRKVHVYEFQHSWNPFKKWATIIKTFDWDDLHAQIVEFKGFSGKAYIVRYSLLLSSCKPGTLEVVESFTLKCNVEGGNRYQLGETWAYCRHFMEIGMDGLPKCKPVPRDVSFLRNLFYYIPALDPTEDGREVRTRMAEWEWVIVALLVIVVPWLLFPMGIGRYIAMKLAPEPVWPADLDLNVETESVSGQPVVRML